MKRFKKLERSLIIVMIGLLTANLIVGQLTAKASDEINQSIIDPEIIMAETIDTPLDVTDEDENTADITGDQDETIIEAAQEQLEADNQDDVKSEEDEQAAEQDAENLDTDDISDMGEESQDESAIDILTYEDEEVVVAVGELEEDAFPENVAELSVFPITKENPETAAQYNEVEEKLLEKAENEDYDIAGFVAYDIAIIDIEGNKIEPNGNVKVSMSYKQAPVLAEDAQETVENDDTLESTADLDVTVMHLEEDEAGNVTDVVDLSEVIPEGQTEEQAENMIEKIDTDENNAVSEMVFETSGFSTFAITWKNDGLNALAAGPTTVSIVDKLVTDGIFEANITNPNAASSFAWLKSTDGGANWTEVEPVTYTSGDTNVSEDGKYLYPAFDKGSDASYKVQVMDAAQNVIATSNILKVPYYDSLRNGGFETPQYSDNSGSWHNSGIAAYMNSGGVWNTTSAKQDIEIVHTKYNSSTKRYEQTGDYAQVPISNSAPKEGKQYAELNAEGPGALFQDVLTIPHETLYYSLNHKSRGNSSSNLKECDEMYLVIMPLNTALTGAPNGTELKTQNDLCNFLNRYITDAEDKVPSTGTKCNKSGVETVKLLYDGKEDGIYILKITSDKDGWHTAAGQYLANASVTRFFFISGKTASNSTTVGNFLDDVWFSQDLPPVRDGEFSFTVKKTIEGLDKDSGYPELLGKLQFEVTVNDSKGAYITSTVLGKSPYVLNASEMTADGEGNLSYLFANKTIKSGETYTITVKELNADVTDYTRTKTTAWVDQEAETEAAEISTTVKSKDTKNIQFKNVYKNTVNWHLKKMSKPVAGYESRVLFGAEFQLEKGNTLIATGTSGDDGFVTWTPQTISGSTEKYDLLTLNGTYVLTETKAPSGFALAGSWEMTFDNGRLKKVVVQGTTDELTLTTINTKEPVVTIEDMPLTSLPSTGGSGIYGFMIIGMLILACAVGLMIYSRRKSIIGR